jgi:dTDP-4-dehydrorhamnose reductase
MNIAVFGAYGQLGKSIQRISTDYPEFDFIFTDIDTLDISDYKSVENFVFQRRPDVFVNCVAYTAVDKAESEEILARRVNADAVDNLAKIAGENNVFVVHVSTDYVFDGTAHQPYKEDDNTNPVSVYGKTKLEGEQAVFVNRCRAAVIRTSWLYSEYGVNFVKTMLRLGEERSQLTVVNDQIGSPTYAHDLAEVIMQIIRKNNRIVRQEIYHFSNEGVASWYDFAVEIMLLGHRLCTVSPIPTADYPTPAKRPSYSVLDKQKIKNHFDLSIPFWQDSLAVCIQNILKGSQT